MKCTFPDCTCNLENNGRNECPKQAHKYIKSPVCAFPADSEDTHACECHRRMGNDFWFLPIERCLFDDLKRQS